MAEPEGGTHEDEQEVKPAPPLVAEFQCLQCDRSFTTQQGLTMHVTRSHRPVDQGTAGAQVFKLADQVSGELEVELEHMQNADFSFATETYLPRLEQEIRNRREQGMNDVELIDAFFILWRDAQASA